MPIDSPHRASDPGPYARHIPALDGLRGLAILGVVASHLFPANPAGPLTRGMLFLCSFGARGVDLFFVLSGFLITGILFDSLGDSGYFRKFYGRRSLRIFPLYYGVLLVLFALTPVLHLHWQGMEWVLLTYLQNTSIGIPFYDFSPGSSIYLDHLWSLAVEEQFYLVWPLVVFFLPQRSRLLRAAVGLSVAALVLRLVLVFHAVSYNVVNRSTPCRADALLIGASLALLLRGPHHDRVLRSAPRVLLVSSGTYVAFLVVSLSSPALPWISTFNSFFLALGYTLLALSSAAFIALCLVPASRSQILFQHPLLRFFGRYSYGIYVLHGLLLSSLRPALRRLVETVFPSPYVSIAGAGLLLLLISTAAAVLSYQLYEKPFLRLKRLFPYDRKGTRTEHPQPV